MVQGGPRRRLHGEVARDGALGGGTGAGPREETGSGGSMGTDPRNGSPASACG